MDHDHDDVAEHEPVSYGTYILTWFTLIVLTTVTVTAAGMNFGKLSVMIALLIATIKASVVLYIFMHMKYEGRMFQVMLWVVLGALAIFIGLTFTDTLFR